MRLITNFLLKKSKLKKNGTCPIYIRCILDSKRIELSTGVYVDENCWDNIAQQIVPPSRNAKLFNKKLNSFVTKVHDTYYQLEALGNDFDIYSIKDQITNKPKHHLISIFRTTISNIEQRVGHDYAYGTFKHYKTIYGRLKEFVENRYNKTDIPIVQVDFKFLSLFDSYLRITHNVGPNTVTHYHKKLKKVLNDCLAMGYIEINPYMKFRVKQHHPNRDYLSIEELKRIEEKEILLDRISTVRDIFVFACYTGLSYSDIKQLSQSHIIHIDSNETWISIDRVKTSNRCRIPLLPKAKTILDKYANHPKCINSFKLLPTNSNQRMNSYLKEIADICKINKDLTMHVARHTFATTITLTNGVPIETVSKMLGHNSLKTTQIYGKIVDSKIRSDMAKLKEMF